MIRSAVLIQYTRVTDRRTELAWHIRAIAYMLSRVKRNVHRHEETAFFCRAVGSMDRSQTEVGTSQRSSVCLYAPPLFYLHYPSYCNHHITQSAQKTRIKNYNDNMEGSMRTIGSRFNSIFTAQCTSVHMRGLGIACRPSVCPSICDVGGL